MVLDNTSERSRQAWESKSLPCPEKSFKLHPQAPSQAVLNNIMLKKAF
jgi:hypothetical protein